MCITAFDRTWAEINLDNIAFNYCSFKKLTGKRVMCVLKADAYGHGAVALAKRLEYEGCDAFGVATLDEGLELRRAGIGAFILLFNHVSKERINEAANANLTMTVYSVEMAELISKALEGGEKANQKIHIKIDTGMTRVGLNTDEAVDSVKKISKLPKIETEGIYTHFSSADETDTAYTKMQIEKFQNVCEQLEKNGLKMKIKHAANSAAAIAYPDARFDMVRVGISLYGCYPSSEVSEFKNTVVLKDFDLKKAMQLKTRIYRINEVECGVAVSYGRKFITKRKTRLATIPIGYADGLSRLMTGKLIVLINGQEATVVGRICMDQCMVDITDITGKVSVFDEVVIFGQQNNKTLPVESVADTMGTINYEILCMVSRRVPRVYFENGKTTGVKNYLT